MNLENFIFGGKKFVGYTFVGYTFVGYTFVGYTSGSYTMSVTQWQLVVACAAPWAYIDYACVYNQVYQH